MLLLPLRLSGEKPLLLPDLSVGYVLALKGWEEDGVRIIYDTHLS